ncbi:MAG: hypothetical protein IPP97_07450 [Candidatus Obscuribacter sp.]|nr:hypothetical protein [Candidatus Obscuribacter sp.]
MVTHKPDNAEAAVVPAQVEGRHTHLSAENAGVSMTSVDTNAAHRAMRTAASGGEGLGDLVITGAATRDRSTVGNDSATPKDRAAAVNDTAKQQDWQPSLKSDIFNDFTIEGKNKYNEWAGREARRHNLVENEGKDHTEENAFRHALTSAIYSMKYGSTASLEMGWANEQKDFNIVTSLRGKIDLAKIADTNADLLNNRSGIEIAQRLVREKGEGNVTIKDLEDAVMRDLRAGKLVTHPQQELRSGRLAPEMLSYHRMPGLIQWEAQNGPTESDRARAREILQHRGIK